MLGEQPEPLLGGGQGHVDQHRVALGGEVDQRLDLPDLALLAGGPGHLEGEVAVYAQADAGNQQQADEQVEGQS